MLLNKYHRRTSLTVSVEWEQLQLVKDLAIKNRMNMSEVVSECFNDFIKRNTIQHDYDSITKKK